MRCCSIILKLFYSSSSSVKPGGTARILLQVNGHAMMGICSMQRCAQQIFHILKFVTQGLLSKRSTTVEQYTIHFIYHTVLLRMFLSLLKYLHHGIIVFFFYTMDEDALLIRPLFIVSFWICLGCCCTFAERLSFHGFARNFDFR